MYPLLRDHLIHNTQLFLHWGSGRAQVCCQCANVVESRREAGLKASGPHQYYSTVGRRGADQILIYHPSIRSLSPVSVTHRKHTHTHRVSAQLFRAPQGELRLSVTWSQSSVQGQTQSKDDEALMRSSAVQTQGCESQS